MSTASFELAQSIPDRIGEILVLLEEAKEVQNSAEALYNALCRASCVLLASHLEGFLKDLSSSIIKDLNYHNQSFSQMPAAMQRAFCKKIVFYEGVPSPEVENRVKQLLRFFAENSVEIDMTAFSYKGNQNKNPSVNMIESSLEILGVPSVLSSIAIPSFEVVFDNDERTNYRLSRDLRRFVSYLYLFPFKSMPEPYRPAHRAKRKDVKNGQSLWHTYVEEMLTRRHSIAHGEVRSNETSWGELQRDAEKMRVLMYGLVFSAAGYLSSDVE